MRRSEVAGTVELRTQSGDRAAVAELVARSLAGRCSSPRLPAGHARPAEVSSRSRGSDFFADGRGAAARRGHGRARLPHEDDDLFYTGKVERRSSVDEIPLPVTAQVLERGSSASTSTARRATADRRRQRHGRAARLPAAAVVPRPTAAQAAGRLFFDVITNGFGAMPDYAAQIAPEDRWAIVAYIRALQLSQRATIGRRAWQSERARRPTTGGRAPAGRAGRSDLGDAGAVARPTAMAPRRRSDRPTDRSYTARARSPHAAHRARSSAGRPRLVRSRLRCHPRAVLPVVSAGVTCSGSASRSARSALMMVHHLSGGAWGLVVRRVVRGGERARCRSWRCSSCPSLLGMHDLYSGRTPTRSRRRGPAAARRRT